MCRTASTHMRLNNWIPTVVNRPLGESWCFPCFKHSLWRRRYPLLQYYFSVHCWSINQAWRACYWSHTHMSVETMLFMCSFLAVHSDWCGYSHTGTITSNVAHRERDIDWDQHSSPVSVTSVHERKARVWMIGWHCTLVCKGACVCFCELSR